MYRKQVDKLDGEGFLSTNVVVDIFKKAKYFSPKGILQLQKYKTTETSVSFT